MTKSELPPQPVSSENGVRPLLTVEETQRLTDSLREGLETVLRPWMERKAQEGIHHLPRRLANVRFKG